MRLGGLDDSARRGEVRRERHRPHAVGEPEEAHRAEPVPEHRHRPQDGGSLQPWEEFDGKVDRIVSIGAFEHFGFNKYDDYFKKTFSWMPDDGVMLLHTIIIPEDEEIKAKKLPLTMSRVRFIKFIMDEIYPAAGCRSPRWSVSTQSRPATT